jgi:hypothetical protein
MIAASKHDIPPQAAVLLNGDKMEKEVEIDGNIDFEVMETMFVV